MSRWSVLGLVAILTVASISVVVFTNAPPELDEYSMYNHNPYYVAFSANDNYLLARYSGSDGLVQLFGMDDNVPLWAASFSTRVESASVSGDGSYIAAGARDALYLFIKNSNSPIWVFYPTNSLKKVVMSMSGEYLVCADYDKLNFFTKEDNEPLWSWSGYGESVSISSDSSYIVVNNMLFKKDGTLLRSYSNSISAISENVSYLVAHGGWAVHAYSRDNGSPLWSYDFGTTVRKSSISADGNYLVAIASEYFYHPDGDGLREILYLFSRENSEPIWSSTLDEIIGVQTAPASLLAISSDGSYIAAGTHRKVHLFSREDNTPLWTLEVPEHEEAYSVAVASDGSYIAVGTEGGPAPNTGGSIHLFDRDGNLLWSYRYEIGTYPPP